MRNRILAAALAAAPIAAAPIGADAAPISSYPAATTPLSGSETVIGTQSGSTVQITAASIAAIVTGATNTWTGVQTFPAPGASHGSIVLTPGTLSGTPANGSLWTTSSGLFAQIGGATQQYATLGANTFAGTQTFADGGTWGSTGISGLSGLQLVTNHQLTWNGSVLGLVSGGSAGSARLDFKEGLTLYGSLEENSGIAQWVAGSSGAAGTGGYCYGLSITGCMWGDGTIFAGGIARPIFNFGNSTADDASGQIGAGIGAFSYKIDTPDGGVFGAASNQLIWPFVMDPPNTTPETVPTPSAHALTVSTIGNPLYAGAEIIGSPEYNATIGSGWTGWGLCLDATDGFELACTEAGAAGENHLLTIGFNRFGNAYGTNTAALIIEDMVASAGKLTGLSGGLGGSGLTVPPTLSFSGGCTAQVATAINGGQVVGYSIYNPGFGGASCAGATVTLTNPGAGTLPSAPTVVTAVGNKAGPQEIFDTQGPFMGMGQDNSNFPMGPVGFRIGVSDNFGAPGTWDDVAANQWPIGIPGGVAFGTNVTSAGYGEMLKDSSGLLDLTTPHQGGAGSHAVGLQLGFERLVPVILSSLSTVDPTPGVGDRATVTDATSCTFNIAVTGGGSTKCPVYYDGSAWRAG
jgi:hypothetical protein